MAYMGDIFIVLMLVLLVTGLLWKFSMLRLNGASRSFYSVVREWEQALGVTDRYETPWFLMLGEDEQSEVLLRSWALPVQRNMLGSAAGGTDLTARFWWCPALCSSTPRALAYRLKYGANC